MNFAFIITFCEVQKSSTNPTDNVHQYLSVNTDEKSALRNLLLNLDNYDLIPLMLDSISLYDPKVLIFEQNNPVIDKNNISMHVNYLTDLFYNYKDILVLFYKLDLC
jgi:hypothetical protein